MKKRHNDHVLPPAYEGVERQLMALFYSGVYITNADIVRVAETLGFEGYGLKDRISLLKDLMHEAHESGRKAAMMQAFMTILQERAQAYQELVHAYPAASQILGDMIQKARATAMLLQREMRSDPYA